MHANPLKIAFIVPFLFRYQRGIERSCVHLANTLVKLGHQVTLVAWREKVAQTSFQIDPAIRILAVPYFRYYRAVWAIPFYVFYLLTHPFDVLHVYFAGYGEAQSLRLAHALRKFKITYIVGYPIEQVPHRFAEFRRLRLEPLLDWIVVKSPEMAPGIELFFNRRVLVIPNGIDTELFDPVTVDAAPIQKKLGINPGDPVLLTVAALEERKGIQYTIQVLPVLLEKYPALHYVIAGEGPYLETLIAFVEALGVADHVHLVGKIADVRPYYRMADLFILLARGEGLPNVLLEAWAMGKPVVVAAEPPFPSIVPAEIGTLVHRDDGVHLVEAIQYGLDRGCFGFHPSLARDHVVSGYQWLSVAQKYLSLYFNEETI